MSYLIRASEQPWQPHPRFEGAAVCPLIQAAQHLGLTVNLVRLEPGCGLPLHTHEHSTETFYILRGQARCRVGEEEQVIGPGVLGYAPPGVPHQVTNVGTETLEALSIFQPPPA